VPEPLRPDSLVVAAGRPAPGPDAPVNVPVVLSSTFHAGGPVGYARSSNPTWEALEDVLGRLEGGRALVFASGMGATSAVLELVPLGGVVVAPVLAYNGTTSRLADLERARHLQVRTVDVSDADAVAAACQGAAMLWLESPTNPTMDVCDLRAAADAARAHGVLTVCDNTFATPLLQRPLELGVDVVVHSATKALSGHSDVLLGATVVRDHALYDRIKRARTLVGSIAGPFEAWLALRGVRTLALRQRQACASAMELATRLAAHPAVTSVRYPGLSDDPGHAVAARQMSAFGSLLSFRTVGSPEAIDAACASTSLVVFATSLGGVETSWERRRRWTEEPAGTPENLVRLSVGIEDVEDIWADLAQALDRLV